ncbi:unnamed protein product [Haemonchus placei]|uniref:Uncharacterized protein n=1 Tax=Haemonchus placei TaxID=6290 RepID=A0A3P8C5F5_HAEPC|nr:unnamed protein product [Haemonchus placei]
MLGWGKGHSARSTTTRQTRWRISGCPFSLTQTSWIPGSGIRLKSCCNHRSTLAVTKWLSYDIRCPSFM